MREWRIEMAAASQLGIRDVGVARVRYRIIHRPSVRGG